MFKTKYILILSIITSITNGLNDFSRSGYISMPESDLNVEGYGGILAGSDIDGDGEPDIFIVNSMWDGPGDAIPRIYKLEPNGSGGWAVVWEATAPIDLQNTWPALAITDLDGDGKQEITWGPANFPTGNMPNPPRILVYEESGNGNDVMGVITPDTHSSGEALHYLPNASTTIVDESLNIRPTRFWMSDIDGDGTNELCYNDRKGDSNGEGVGHYFGIISVTNISNTGQDNGNWDLEASMLTTGINSDTDIYPLENKYDSFVLGNNLYLPEQSSITKITATGANTYEHAAQLPPLAGGMTFNAAQVVDLNGDGIEECIIAEYDFGSEDISSVVLLQEDGNTLVHTVLATMDTDTYADGWTRFMGSAMGDVDGDGNHDFIFGSRYSLQNACIFRLAYKGGNITDPANYELTVVDSVYAEGGNAWDVVAVGNIDDDPEDEILYGHQGIAGTASNNGTKDIVILDYMYTVRHVPADYATIQEGIDAASDGDVVLVAAGTYVENINFNGKNIVVTSLEGANSTIIDGNQAGSVVTFNNGENSTAELSRLTIQNGYGSGMEGYANRGGGIFCINANPTLKNLIIKGNHAEMSGAGIWFGYSDAQLVDIIVSDNTVTGEEIVAGGGISINYNSNPTLNNVLVADNEAPYGAGIELWSYSKPLLKNVTVVNNTGSYGGGLLLSGGSHPTLINTILRENSPQEIEMGLTENQPDTVSISYSNLKGGQDSIVTNNNSIVNWGMENIDSNPIFCDPENGDYTLAENSSCLGTGEDDNNIGAFGIGCGPIDINIYVATTGSDNNDGSLDSPFATIQAGINAAINGDTVSVAAGTYHENIEINNKNINLVGENWATTFIVPLSLSPIIILKESDAYVSGFTLRDNDGLAIAVNQYSENYCNPIFDNIMVTGCGGNAEPIYFAYSNPIFKNSSIINNPSTGISCFHSNAIIENVTIASNNAPSLVSLNSQPTLVNCILWSNESGENEIEGSATVTYSNIKGSWEGEGNIDSDPLFCNPDSGDFTLAENSPCIESGENEADMGAFGVGCGPIDIELVVNFSFDLSCYHGIFEELSGGYTPYIKGNWNNWDNSIPMSDEDGDHIWTASANLSDGEYIFYVYAEGPTHYFTLLAPVGSECDYYNDDPIGNWGFEINDSTGDELNLPTYSPNSCSECSTNEYFYLTHDGHERFYIVHLPDGYEELNEDVPLILNLHAYSKYALYQQLMTGLDYWADMQNVITVYPQAIPGPGGVRAWNCGINGNPDFPTTNVDDVGFISTLIDTLIENYSIDPDRIYSCGMSNGGFMSYKLACELNDKITAIGSVTGTFAESDAEECSIERFMPVIDFHGTNDNVVSYFGDEGWMSVDETVAFWTDHNDTDTEETYEYPDIVIEDNSTVNRFTYTNSSNNVQVVQFQIMDGGHEWPGAGYNYGWNNYDVNAGAELVDFFLQYRLSDLLYVNKNDLHPTRFSLHQNYPNPFNPVTTLRYDLPEDAMVNITIFDMMGRVIKTIVNSQQNAGFKSVRWNATNDYGKPVSAGIYLYMIQAGEYRQTRKMVLLK